MQAESTESPVAVIEDSYSYTELAGSSLWRTPWTSESPTQYFRYRVIKRVLAGGGIDTGDAAGVGNGGDDGRDELSGADLLFAPAYSEAWGILFDVEVPDNVRELG